MAKSRHRYRVCSYVDNFANSPSFGRAETSADFRSPSTRLVTLLERNDLTRHPSKGAWDGTDQVLKQLGFIIDTINGTLGVPAIKMEVRESGDESHQDDAVHCSSCPGQGPVFLGLPDAKPRIAVPDTPFRLRTLNDALHGKTDKC